MGGDTPPEDDPCGADDDVNADPMDRDLQDDENDNCPETSRTRKHSSHDTAKVESKTLKHSPGLSSGSSRNSSSMASTNLPGKKATESHIKHSKSSDRACGVGEGVSTPKASPGGQSVIPATNSSSTPVSSASNNFSNSSATSCPSSSSLRQSSKRSTKERDRGESTSSIRSRGNRQTFGRVRAQSGGGEVYGPSSPSSDTGGSSVIRVSSSASVMSVATGGTTPTNSPRKGRKEDGWKEVGRR